MGSSDITTNSQMRRMLTNRIPLLESLLKLMSQEKVILKVLQTLVSIM